MDLLCFSVFLPGDDLIVKIDVHVLRNIDNTRVFLINGIPLRLEVHDITVVFHNLLEVVIHFRHVVA